MNVGAIILLAGLVLVGRGLLDINRSRSIADANHRRNVGMRDASANAQAAHRERFGRASSNPETVRRQGRNILNFGLMVMAAGVVVTIFF